MRTLALILLLTLATPAGAEVYDQPTTEDGYLAAYQRALQAADEAPEQSVNTEVLRVHTDAIRRLEAEIRILNERITTLEAKRKR